MPEREPGAASSGKTDKAQLGNRIYFNSAYTEVVRAIGYAGFPLREADQRLEPLAERFGRDRIQEVFRELMTLLFAGKEKRSGPEQDAEVRLKPEVRKLAWQLLGPPPEQRPVDMRIPGGQTQTAERKPKSAAPKPRRKKDAAASPAPAGEAAAATSMLQQYREAKERHPGMLLLFRSKREPSRPGCLS